MIVITFIQNCIFYSLHKQIRLKLIFSRTKSKLSLKNSKCAEPWKFLRFLYLHCTLSIQIFLLESYFGSRKKWGDGGLVGNSKKFIFPSQIMWLSSCVHNKLWIKPCNSIEMWIIGIIMLGYYAKDGQTQLFIKVNQQEREK